MSMKTPFTRLSQFLQRFLFYSPKKKMFGKQRPNKEFDMNNLDGLLHSNIEEDDHVDLNDPELLKQLQDLSSGNIKPQTRKSRPVENMDIDIDSFTALATGDDDVHVELDESDFSNPHLLDELSALTSKKEIQQDQIPEKEINSVMEDKNKDDKEEMVPEEETDPQVLKEKVQSYQKMALEAKRSGDKKRAVELLRESKTYNQKYQELLEIQSAITNTAENIEPVKEEQHIVVPEPQNDAELQKLLTRTISLQKKYKEAALYYKKIGNISAAKQMVRTSKELLYTGIKLKNGEIFDPQSVQLPDSPDMTLSDGKMRQLNPTQPPSIASREGIESELLHQINVCHNLALQNQNTHRDSKQDAYQQVEKAFSADLVSLRAHESSALPALHYEQVNYVYKNLNDHIPSNMMEFKVIRATGLPTLDIATSLEPFVTWDFGGWPPENTAQASMNKGETPVQKGVEPHFDFSLMIPITRTNRVFLRYLQRKKLIIEVFHNKYTYGLFRRPVLLGRAVISMDRLLTKSSISGSFDLLDSSRKKTGGKIDIQVNLRDPLSEEDTVKRSERWLILDAFDSHASVCLSAAKLTTGGPQVPSSRTMASSEAVSEASPVVSPAVVNSPPKAQEPRPESKQATPAEPTQTQKETSNEELEEAEEEFNSVDSIVSNMVLEHEIALVSTGSSKDDLIDRKQALEIKMNMLVIQVQTGMLDIETYLKDVEKRMEQDRRLAIVFKKNNRLDLAKAALARKKIMQSELDEARAAMAED
ncbi:unnamed protein product [Rhizopus stolonifer]